MPATSPPTSFASQTFHFDEDPADPLLFLTVMRIRRLTLKRVRIRPILLMRIQLPEMIRIRNTGSDETERKGAQISNQNVGENGRYRKESQALVSVSHSGHTTFLL